MAKASTAVAKTEETGIARMTDEDFARMALEDAGAGMERVTSQDLVIPFLAILQTLSPQVDKREPEYVEGAEPGMIYNPATGMLYPANTGILFIPALYMRRHVEWNKREDGGGIVRDWGEDDSRLQECTRNDRNQDVTPDGTVIVVSGTWYGLLADTGEQVVIGMSSTQLKKSRQWITSARTLKEPVPGNPNQKFTPPLFYYSYRLTTVPESNDQGKWDGWKVTRDVQTRALPNGDELYLAAKAFKKSIEEGAVKLAQEGVTAGNKPDDEIPF